MKRYFFKPVLANPSLGARITYLMKLKGYSDENMAELFGVNINAIKPYSFKEPIEQIYYHTWEEEQFPYSKLVIDIDSYKRTANNELVVKGLTEWEKMREKRINGEITVEEYIEWKLNLEL